MRRYRLPFNGTITNAGGNHDILSIRPASNKPIYLVKFVIGNLSDWGDAQEESLRLTVKRMTATVTDGTGGAAGTIALPDGNDASAGLSFRALDTAVSTTSGTTATLAELSWNVRATPMEFNFPDVMTGEAFRAQNAESLLIVCETTVADDISVNGYADVFEA